MSTAETKFVANQAKFAELTAQPVDDQLAFFLKSFIFDLGDDWKHVVTLQKEFTKRASESGEGKPDLNPVMAADFLQKHGVERTALQRKEEISDVDLDNNQRIAFCEYLLLHYKKMILEAYYKRVESKCPHDLSRGGIGITGVGKELLDELFTLPVGMNPELEKAITEFMAQKKAREEKLKELEAKAAAGGVKGLAAANEIKQMESQDTTEMNRIELTLNAAKKKASTASGDEALKAKQKAEEDAVKAMEAASREKLKARAAMFEAAK